MVFCNSGLVDLHQSEILKLSKLRLNALVKKSWASPHTRPRWEQQQFPLASLLTRVLAEQRPCLTASSPSIALVRIAALQHSP